MESREEVDSGKWTWLIPLGLVLALVAAYFVWPAFHRFVEEAYGAFSTGDQARIEAWVNGFGVWGFAVMLALMLMQTLLAFLPSFVLMVVSILAFGPVTGGILAWVGLVMAAGLGYAIGRSLGVAGVDRLVGSKTERKISGYVERYGTWAVVAARISPVLSTDAVSIVAGVLKMRFLRFLIATAAGTLPLTILVAWLGSNANRMKTGLVWVSVVSVAVFVAYVFYDRRKATR